jgi:two-component system sensor histidine kinase/response regulator
MPTPTGLRVLVAEDNPINQRVAVAMLRALGHQGVVVGDGEKALRALSQLTFDVVLMDVTMPNTDGMSALAELQERKRQGVRTPPVIMVTAHDLPGDREHFLAAGADGYVAKPMDVAALTAELRRVLGR